MLMFYSGQIGHGDGPELPAIAQDLKPKIMLSYFLLNESTGSKEGEFARNQRRLARCMKDNPDRYHLFIDSGAWGLYRRYVLPAPLLEGNKRDYSFYDFEPGSRFRKYCNSYAKFIRSMEGQIELFANLDVIGSPELTWKVQLLFEKEYGLRLVPVVHHGASLAWVDKYLERGYDLIGLGGMAAGVGSPDIQRWCDIVFRHLCPKSNDYLPIVRTHGFAITSWTFMQRWPWWSVDSTSWMKIAAFGGVLIPKWKEKRWRFDLPPMNIGFSYRSTKRTERHIHYQTLAAGSRKDVDRWLEEIGIEPQELIGSATEKEADGHGLDFINGSVHEPLGRQQPSRDKRARANIIFFNAFVKALPKWPWPIDPAKVKKVDGLLF